MPNRVVIGLSELLFPAYLKFVLRLSIDFVDSSELTLKLLADNPVVIAVNHSDKQDPFIVVALAKYMHDIVYCPTAREVFDWNHGIIGWLIQRFGCFSVNRGVVDTRSIRTIQNILTHGRNRMVVFPEAEVTGDDRSVHEVSHALVHVLLRAQNELAKDRSEPICILPVGVSYSLETALQSSVVPTLNLIERKLSIRQSDQLPDLDTRLRGAIDEVLHAISEQYRFKLPEEQPHHEQVSLLARHICTRISAYISDEAASVAKEETTESLLHRLRNEVMNYDYSKRVQSPYRRGLRKRNSNSAREWVGDLDRVERLLIFQRVLNQTASPIQTCRVVDFLENEVCGRMTAKGRQRARVVLGEPIDVSPYLELYKSSKSDAIEQLSTTVRDAIQSTLDKSHSQDRLEAQAGEPLSDMGTASQLQESTSATK